MDHHAQDTNSVLKTLKTTAEGLSSKEATKRLEEYGPNELKEKKGVNPLKIFFYQFNSIVVIILLVATVISALFGEPIEGIVIFAIIFFNASFGTFQEYRAEKAMEALREMAAEKAIVLRDGKQKRVHSSEIVPGDVIVLHPGDIVPADARLIEAINLKVDESAITGESIPSGKYTHSTDTKAALADRENMVYTHSVITYGRGKAVIVGTAMNTEMGKIAEFIHDTGEKQTPMQRRLNEVGFKLGIIVVAICALIFLLEMWKTGFAVDQERFVFFFMIAVSLAVSAIPEGLPAVVTITLALGLQRMAKKKAVIRKLAAVETLGSTTVICSDKTGTLTKDQMTVTEFYVDNQTYEVTGTGYDFTGAITKNRRQVEQTTSIETFINIGVHCNDAEVREDEMIGDPTEAALIVLGKKIGINQTKKRTGELPFESERKMMSTLHKNLQYTKGAPEEVLAKSTKIYENGKELLLTPAKKRDLLKENQRMAKKALRVLALAYKKTTELDENALVFVGLVGMKDPAREEAKDAIAICKQAGIRVIMITGDNKITAEAIADALGLGKGLSCIGNDIDNATNPE
ncbi:HAD-IC family P-type ATPase, partial [archaeon]|nr:HAD-IC family P-type ATPase [archaeon]